MCRCYIADISKTSGVVFCVCVFLGTHPYLGVVRDLLLPHLALLQETGDCHRCVVRVRERIAPNAGSARTLLMLESHKDRRRKSRAGNGDIKAHFFS
jgi:hypothetical protein